MEDDDGASASRRARDRDTPGASDLDAAERDEALAQRFSALASSVRLALLREVAVPRTVTEIRVKPSAAAAGGGGADRSVSRQTVREHLDRLVAAGLVLPRETERSRGPTTEYVLNHQELYALAEEFREMARLRPAAELALATLDGPDRRETGNLAGPCLLLVKGLGEGRAFDLAPRRGDGRDEWVIGRRRGVDVSLDYDRFVSTENALVTLENGAYAIADVPESRNGTLVNFRALERGEKKRLANGDLVGVGRSLLLFRG